MREDIEAVDREFEAAMKAGNALGLAGVYTTTGQALPPNAATVSGKEDIAAFWQGAIDMGVTGVELESVELEELGDTAIQVGHFTLKTADGSVADNGKYIVIWKQEDGAWKWHRDIWNSSNPVA
ncbi:YybH family protein [Denitrobaculum tricleocarpae]|uniref:DUF4440 domain-containing protein n=1 Tax=Denitrobaculum tricleocarpae TaxID=2591009 RepID=A0A545TMZ8_9PROT|nr:DUF4440 domain-containing protein [Denitrobaculum tricleocarpae]TQV78566.1 DUF4440 domain-containing protein [Denitrobaculum tricleocarpae]